MTFKFLSLNIWNGGRLFDNILEFLKLEQPDIICLQEVFDGHDQQLSARLRSMAILKAALPNHDYFFSAESLCATNEGKVDIGNAIFSRFPLLKTETIFLSSQYCEAEKEPVSQDWSQDPKNLQHATINVRGQELHIFNMHGVWGLDGGDNPNRLHMSQVIIEQTKDLSNVILAGDFNVRPETKTITAIEQQLKNVFKDEFATTFNLAHKNLEKFPGYATAVVDMVFVSPDLPVVAHYSPQADVSDHLPLVIEVDA